ncbi:MFS transporter [Glaciimonas sp. Gout2]|uniref:MFS transporter n=1 Tax=unclassified Glaciimonas TaxID=2644401 RepID=UPI002B23CC78|nr:MULTISPECIES: MFS transporter [unclassified Glaciimonas]MEB0010977.1 MFS transporter [Glaciimonas sp. Cout2]MEB0083292.1 MFS transporter [Glaciimonas sp. Gout2]
MALHSAAAHSSDQILPFRESLLAMLGIAFVIMLVGLDSTIVGTALPTIVAELKGFDLYAWVATSYLLTSVITVPIFGRLGDYYGRKPFVIVSIILFTGASILCGLADSMLWLVIGRGVQGIGGGMLVGTAFACIPDLFPGAHTRLRWQVMMSTAFGISTAVGPSLGGFLTQYWGWRWVFFVNFPVGLLSLFFVWKYLPHLRHSDPDAKIRLDWPGALLITAALGCLQLFVEMLPKQGLSLGMLTLLVASIASFYALWKWEHHAPQPILPFDLLFHPKLATLFLLSLLSGFSMFSLMFFAPLLYQGGFGLPPQEAGLLITPLVAFIMVGSIANGRIITRIKNPIVMLYIGFILLALSCFGVVISNRWTSHNVIASFMLMGGLGLGFILPNLTVFIQQEAGREHLGIATALMQSLRMIGSMIGTAIIGTLINHMYASSVQQALESDNAGKWLPSFADPQILISHETQTLVLKQLADAGHNGQLLLEAARDGLIGSIHMGVGLAVIVTVIGVGLVRRVPKVSLNAQSPATIVSE